jgi:aryl-alcohol dehydrogenase-like predicted oxidoreductase
MKKLTPEEKAQLDRRLELTEGKIVSAQASENAATTFEEQQEHEARRFVFEQERRALVYRLAEDELAEAYAADPVARDLAIAPTPVPILK